MKANMVMNVKYKIAFIFTIRIFVTWCFDDDIFQRTIFSSAKSKSNSSISREAVTAARQSILLQAMARCPSLIPLSYEAKAHDQPCSAVRLCLFFLAFFLSLSLTFSRMIRALPRRTRERRFMLTVISRLVLSFPHSFRFFCRHERRGSIVSPEAIKRPEEWRAHSSTWDSCMRESACECARDNAPPPPLCVSSGFFRW